MHGRVRSCAVVRAWSPRTTAVPIPPPWGGVGTASTNGRAWSVMRGRSCVVGHAWSVVRERSCARGRVCVIGHAWSCMVVRARSCAVVRVRGWSCVVVRGRAVVPFCPLRGQHCRGTNERTTSINPLNPPGVGWVNLFYIFKVRVSIRTCVPNLGSFRRACRKFCLSNL